GLLHRDRAVGSRLGIGRAHHHDAAFVGDDDVARIDRLAAARDRRAERAAHADALGRDRGKPAAPHGDAVLANLADVGDDAVDDHTSYFGNLGGIADHAAESGVPRVAAAVDDLDVARAKLAQRIADDRAVDAGLMDGDGGTRNSYILLHRPERGIHEAPMTKMA